MASDTTWTARRTRVMNRVHARLAGRGRTMTAFVSAPEPRSTGRVARGRQLLAGNFLFAGRLIQAPGASIWDVCADDPAFAAAVQGCTWLDDLAAVGDGRARATAQAWIADWIARHDRGRGPGWTPDLTGRRLIRWINHALFVLQGQDRDACDAFYRSLARQTDFLSRRWHAAAPGLPRFEALTGLIHAGLSLEGLDAEVATATEALARECDTRIGPDGGIDSRNPEELLEIFTLLTWAAHALDHAGRAHGAGHEAAMQRIAPVLRALRHSDGALARFHGGGRGLEGRLDRALADAGVRRTGGRDLNMGYLRLTAGRTSIVADAAAPPRGPDGHAATLAFELTSGRRPLIVNCGSGASFGADWRRAGRATPSHSTLGIDGHSSSRLDAAGRIADGTREVLFELHEMQGALRAEIAHDGWRRTHGLTHARTLDVSLDGRTLSGEDMLTTLDDADAARFDAAFHAGPPDGIAFSVRFHLHPDVDASVDLGGAAISLGLKSGEIWILRAEGAERMRLEPSVYLERGRLAPRAATQVVLTGRAMAYATRVRWTLAKAQGTPDGVRDTVPPTPDE